MPTQIHGHDFACIAVLAGTRSPCYASGSEEKVIRIREAPLALGAGEAPHLSSVSRSNGGHKQVRSPSFSCCCDIAHRNLQAQSKRKAWV